MTGPKTTLAIAEVWQGTTLLESFTAYRETDARWKAHLYCRSTGVRGHRIHVYFNLCGEDL